eukprot:3671583-Amphidinium_carterae.1
MACCHRTAVEQLHARVAQDELRVRNTVSTPFLNALMLAIKLERSLVRRMPRMRISGWAG